MLKTLLIAAMGAACTTDQIEFTPAVEGIEVRLDASNLAVGATLQAVATLKDGQGHSQAVSGDTVLWASSNTSVATVNASNGVIRAVTPGTAAISASLGSKTGTAMLTVSSDGGSQSPVASVALTFDSPILVGQAANAVATLRDAAGATLTGRVTTWATDNPAVATVSDAGVVTGVSAGETLVRVTSEGKTAGTPVEVVAQVASLDIDDDPGAAVSGAPFGVQPTVRILDGADRLNAQSTLAVTARVASGTGTLSGTKTVNAVNGIATFTDLSISGTGAHSLTFSTSSPALSVTSNTFNVVAQAAAKLALVTQPSATATSGLAFAQQPVIELRDASDAPVKTAGVAVVATIASGSGTLRGTTTVSTDTAGRAVFTNLYISGTGSAALKFTAGNATITSSTVTVNAALSARQAVPSVSGQVSQVLAAVVPVTATGGSTPYTYALSGATLPAGLAFSTSTGAVSGTPTATLGTTTFTVKVTDAVGATASRTFQLTVTDAAAPLATSVAVASTVGDVNRAISAFAPVTASGGTAPYTFALTGGTLPAGLSFDVGSGQISGTPTATLAATTFTVTVTDEAGATSSKTFQLTINAALATTQAVASTASTVNRPIPTFAPVTVSGGTTPYAYALSGGSLPTGMSFSTSTGAVSGTPTGTLTSGRTYTVTVTDAIGATSAKTFALTINAALTTTQAIASRTGTVGQALTAFTPVTAANGTTPYTYALSGGTLPTGVSFSTTTGRISGTPTKSLAATTFTVTATDAAGATSSKTFQFTVNVSSPLTATQVTANVNGTVNTAVSASPVAASGGTTPYTYALSGGSLPAGLSYNTSTGVLSGTPTATFSATSFTVTITDANGATASATFSLSIAAAPPAGTAWMTEDFSTYTNTANFMKDPRGIYALAEDIQTSRIVLDTTVGYGSSTKSMRYDWPDRTSEGGSGTSGRCTDYTMSRSLKFPNNGAIQEVWVEVMVKTSANFTTQAPASWGCTSDQGYKFLDGNVDPGDRFSIGFRTGLTPPSSGQLWFGYPANVTDPQGKVNWSKTGNMADGNWHQYRCYWKISTGYPNAPNADGRITCWVDGVLVVDEPGIKTTSTAGNKPPRQFYVLSLGRNVNQGPDHAQSLWWGQVKIYQTNPGWQ